MADARVFEQTVDLSPQGHAIMCFREGEKSIGLRLFTEIITKFPASYMAMAKENTGIDIEEEDNG